VKLKITALEVMALYKELCAFVTVTLQTEPAMPEVNTPAELIEQPPCVGVAR
jgi:hypothetical protein